MSREIVIKQVPSHLPLSEVIKLFEQFGEVTRGSVDERRRHREAFINIFITFESHVGAERAIRKGQMEIERYWCPIERVRYRQQRPDLRNRLKPKTQEEKDKKKNNWQVNEISSPKNCEKNLKFEGTYSK